MKKLLSILIYLHLYCTSWGQNNCKPDYHAINWQPVDSITSFYLCSGSDTQLTSTDFVDIEYLGVLQKDENLIIQKDTDKAILSILTNAKFGRFNVNDTTLPKGIRFVLHQLMKKSKATIKYNLGKKKPFEPAEKIAVYFKDNIDSVAAAKWINGIKTKSFVDSTYYLSKDAALRNWSKDQGDSSWMAILKNNPLPSSVDIYIKARYYNAAFIRSLKEEFLKSTIVSDVAYSNVLIEENVKAFNEMLTNTYLIRIKPEE